MSGVNAHMILGPSVMRSYSQNTDNNHQTKAWQRMRLHPLSEAFPLRNKNCQFPGRPMYYGKLPFLSSDMATITIYCAWWHYVAYFSAIGDITCRSLQASRPTIGCQLGTGALRILALTAKGMPSIHAYGGSLTVCVT